MIHFTSSGLSPTTMVHCSLNIIAQDDPVTCAAYAKQHNLLELPKWKKLKHIAKHQKTLIRAINQTKMRQVRRSAVYQ